MARAVPWPDFVTVAGWSLSPVGQSLSSGAGLDGREQIVAVENRIWRGEITLAPLTRQAVQRWGAFVDALNGRINWFDFPVPSPYALQAPASDAVYQAAIGVAPEDILAGFSRFTDGTTFTDGTGFTLPTYAPPMVERAVAAGASSLRAEGGWARQMGAGDLFSVNAYLHRIESVSGSRWTFNPPLRADIAAGALIETEAPVIRLRLATDAGGVGSVGLGMVQGPVKLSVIEVLGR